MIGGHRVQLGVDTSANPVLIRDRSFAIDSVNRMYRGGVNQTRLPFKESMLFFASQKEEDAFRKSNITGVAGYNGVYPYTTPHIIITAGRYIFAGQLMNGNCRMYMIWDQLDPRWANNYFCQAETIMVISNGKDDPLFWNGQTDSVMKCNQSPWAKAPMPKFNSMVYAHGRIFGATEPGIVYAGDHLYSQGINTSDEVVLSFNESQYPSSGDGFTAPSSWGSLTGMTVVERNPSANGHGEVVVFHQLGAYAINPAPPRNEWTTESIQQVLFVGLGGASPESIISINNDVYFRASNRSICSLRESVSDETQNFYNRPISEEVNLYLEFDNFSQLRYSMSGVCDNRALFTVNHVIEDDELDPSIKHRYGLGLVSLDFHRGSASVPDSRSWDGLWTGPRITGMANLTVGKERTCLFLSYDSDKKNRIYFLSQWPGDDVVAGEERQIESMYVTGSIFDMISNQGNDIGEVKIQNEIIFYEHAIGTIGIRSDYSSNFSSTWSSLFSDTEVGLSKPQSTENRILFDPSGGKFLSPSVEDDSQSYASTFNVRTMVRGSVKIHANVLNGSQAKAMNLSYSSSCKEEVADYLVNEENTYNYFTYTF